MWCMIQNGTLMFTFRSWTENVCLRPLTILYMLSESPSWREARVCSVKLGSISEAPIMLQSVQRGSPAIRGEPSRLLGMGRQSWREHQERFRQRARAHTHFLSISYSPAHDQRPPSTTVHLKNAHSFQGRVRARRHREERKMTKKAKKRPQMTDRGRNTKKRKKSVCGCERDRVGRGRWEAGEGLQCVESQQDVVQRILTGIWGSGTRPLALALSCISRRECLRYL